MTQAEQDLARRIREAAYRLWQEAGCPPDREKEFWQIASEVEIGSTPIPEVLQMPHSDSTGDAGV